MTPPPRRPSRNPPRSSGRFASLLFGIGCLVVLAVTFALGMAAGRRWPNGLPGFAASSDATAASKGDRRAEGQGLAKTISESPPVLTFYRELTAPMPPSPPLPRASTKPEAKPKETVKPRPPEPMRPVASEVIKPAAPEAITEARFTVQVGAFKTRFQADALRARLATDGQQVYVSEVEADGSTQYRVRVGSYTTREAAREAALRLAGERQLSTYVTTR